MKDDDKTYNIEALFDYKLHLSVLITIIISISILGEIKFRLFNQITIIILPIIYALIISIILYKSKKITWINIKQSKISNIIILIIIGPLIAKLAILSGQNIQMLVDVGPAIILKELGSLGSIIIALPIAILLGFKRESITMTSSICREPQMAVVVDRFGFDSPEIKGFMMVYLIGTVIGTIILSVTVPILSNIIALHPYSYAIATGIGSTSMNVAAISALNSLYPQMQNQLMAFSSISNIISLILSIYVYMFISLPLAEKLYEKLEPILTRKFKR